MEHMNNYELASVVDIGTAAHLIQGWKIWTLLHIDSDGYVDFQEMVVIDLDETDD
jgi:hypothetical protein